MTDTPIWLLDVDGVINATRPGWHAPPRKATAYADGVGYTMRWAPALLDRIRALARTEAADVRWCTTWCAYADQLERLWGLPTLGRAFDEPINGTAACDAKLAASRQVLADGRRLIWTDDAEVPHPGDPLHNELSEGGRALLIRPRPSRGLQPEDIDAIEAFAGLEVTA